MRRLKLFFNWFRKQSICKFRQILKVYKNLSIKYKLGIILNAVILIPLIAISYVSYKNSENIIRNKSVQYSQDILKTIDLRLSDHILNLNMISQNVISDERIYPTIDSNPLDPLSSYEKDYQLGDILKNIILSVNEIQSICIISDNRYYYADNNKTKISIKNIVPIGSDKLNSLKAQARTEEGAPTWFLDSIDNRVTHILYARTIYDRDNYKEIGVMVILVNTEYFNGIFSSLENKDMQNVAVVSQDNKIILSKNSNTFPVPNSILTQLKGQGWLTDKTNNSLISYTSMENPSWKVVSNVPLDILFEDIQSLRQKIILTCIVTVIIISLFSLFMAYDIISSTSKLIAGMKKVQQGEEGVQIALDRKDEIGYMGEAFNNMVREISMLEKWIYREQLTRKEAEIKSLQAQINPHFLFNTLESINWLAQLQNAPQISKMVTALASLMDASIMRKDKFVSLEKELEYIDDYMMIMKNRFEGRLELIKDVDERTLNIQMPKLLIQPIVENAVYHGIGNSRGKGIVRLVARLNNGMLEIIIEDNGAGIDEEKLEMLNQSLKLDDETYFDNLETRKSSGIGLENVNRRLKLFYGPQNGLSIESKKGEYTRVYMKLSLTIN